MLSLLREIRPWRDKVRGRWIVQRHKMSVLLDNVALHAPRLIDSRISLGFIIRSPAPRLGPPRVVIATDVLAIVEDVPTRELLLAFPMLRA